MRRIAALSILFTLIVLIAFIAFIALTVKSSPVNVNDKVAKPCIPFAAKEVPDETRPEWVLLVNGYWSVSDPVGSDSMVELEVSRHYYNREKEWLGLNVNSYFDFDEVVMKRWECRSSGEDPVTKDKPDYMVAVTKDGKWYVVNDRYYYIQVNKGSNGYVTGITIILGDQHGNLVVERTINRK